MRSYRHRSLASEAEYFYLAHSIMVNERKVARLPLREMGSYSRRHWTIHGIERIEQGFKHVERM
jgi:hypothetical protein